MSGKLLVLLFCVAAVAAFPNEYLTFDDELSADGDQDYLPQLNQLILHRERRQSDRPFQLQGSGGGNRKDGFNVNLDSKFKVWESPNRRHEIHGTAGYSQHLGGQYGSSRPDLRGGAGYTFRF